MPSAAKPPAAYVKECDAPVAYYDALKSAPPALPCLYDHAGQREFIAVRRVQLDRCLREVLERAMRDGGLVTELARDCMLALDAAAAEESGTPPHARDG